MNIPTKWIIIWLPNHGYHFPTSKSTWKPNFAQIEGFLYFDPHFGFKMAAIANQRWISILNIIIYLETKFRPNRRIFVFLRPFCTLVTMATDTILKMFNPPKAVTHYGGYSYKALWSSMKGIQKSFKSPLFCFHGNYGKVCPTNSDCFCLSRSTRCGCCSYQVSSISVWRVTCYDHFCVFHFFSILAVSMATAAILKKSTLSCTISHGIWYSYKVS